LLCLKAGSASDEFVWQLNVCRASGYGAITVHLPGGLSTGSAGDIDTAKAELKMAWKGLKARTTPQQLAAAYKAMNNDS